VRHHLTSRHAASPSWRSNDSHAGASRPGFGATEPGSPPGLHAASKRRERGMSILGVMTTDSRLDDQSLYARIGGRPAVTAAVDGVYVRILGDPELAPYFAGVGIEELKAHQRAFITTALGGPERYAGHPLVDAHRHLRITDTAFARVVGHLTEVLQALGVADEMIAAVISALAPLQPQIVSAS
jgi:hemoglobin